MNANVDYLGLLNLLRGLRDRGLLSEAETKKNRGTSARRTWCHDFRPSLTSCTEKAALRFLTEQESWCYTKTSKSDARARCWSLPLIDLRSKGKPLPLRWRLFLYVPKDTKDNRGKEQQKCKHFHCRHARSPPLGEEQPVSRSYWRDDYITPAISCQFLPPFRGGFSVANKGKTFLIFLRFRYSFLQKNMVLCVAEKRW